MTDLSDKFCVTTYRAPNPQSPENSRCRESVKVETEKAQRKEFDDDNRQFSIDIDEQQDKKIN